MKAKICGKAGIPIEHQWLRLEQGLEDLEDDRTLSDYNQNDSVLELTRLAVKTGHK